MPPNTDEMDTDPSSSLAQAAAEKVQDLVETAADLLGTPQLDDSSLGKLAQMSKELELELEVQMEGDEGVLVHHAEAVDELEAPEEEVQEVASNHYVTAPSSPIIHHCSRNDDANDPDSITERIKGHSSTYYWEEIAVHDYYGTADLMKNITLPVIQERRISARRTSASSPSFELHSRFNRGSAYLSPRHRANQIRRTLSLASVDSLLRVAQDQETRDQFLDNVKEHGKRMVWRDERERRKLPGDAERALVLAVKRGLSEFCISKRGRTQWPVC
ncbi:hypothetical protein QFC24_005934 [Naganishia onofrii]|uniref:Uncharacterized protein n=1 Tax=Naganishia onofrii TaxID=1851511 RepID=A0ACC2X5H1_9TREE|nr:hypothetical protein QFC24_005934 [Naganishia onofrii]